MRRPRWALVVMLVVGAALGLAISGVPSRHQDAPLRIPTESTTIAPPGGATLVPPQPPPR